MKNRVNCRNGEKGHVAIVLMLWGVGILAVGFTIHALFGPLWGLVVIGVIGLIGVYIGIRMIRSANKKKVNNGK